MVGRAVTQDKARQVKLQLENGFLVFEVGLLFLIVPNVLMQNRKKKPKNFFYRCKGWFCKPCTKRPMYGARPLCMEQSEEQWRFRGSFNTNSVCGVTVFGSDYMR